MSKKGKKNQGGAQHNPTKEDKHENDATKADNKQEMTKIIEAINTMDLDSNITANLDKDFIDVKPFDEGKQILINAIDDLHFYIDLFRKGDLSKFPAPTAPPEEKPAAPAAK